ESHEKLLRAGAVESSCLAGSSPSARRPSGVAPPPQQVVPVLVVASRAIRRTGRRFLAHARRVPEKTDGFPGIWWEEVVTPVSAAWRCRSLPCRGNAVSEALFGAARRDHGAWMADAYAAHEVPSGASQKNFILSRRDFPGANGAAPYRE